MDQREPARLVGPRPAGLSDPVFHHRALYQGQLLGHADLHRLSHSVHPAVHRDLRFVELPALRAGHLSDREGPGGLPPLYVDDPAHVFHRDGLLRPRPERTGSAPRRDGAAQLLYLDGAVYLLTRHEHERLPERACARRAGGAVRHLAHAGDEEVDVARVLADLRHPDHRLDALCQAARVHRRAGRAVPRGDRLCCRLRHHRPPP